MFKLSTILKKINTPKTYKVRIYNKHFDDDGYFLMGNHEVDQETLHMLLNAKQIWNNGICTYNIDEVICEFTHLNNEPGRAYVLRTSTVYSSRNEKPSCYTKKMFIPSAFDFEK